MKKILPFVLVLTLSINCKKEVVKAAEDLIVQVMINGQWVVSKYTLGSNDITLNFSGYKFQFYSNKSVDAIKNGVKERSGTWGGSSATLTIWADFPNATSPVLLINGNWNIIDSGLDYVEATQANGTEIKTIKLIKQ